MFKGLFLSVLLAFYSISAHAIILGPNTLAILGPHTLAVIQDARQVSEGLSTYLFRVPSDGSWVVRFWATVSPGSSLAVKVYNGTLASTLATSYTSTLGFTAPTLGQTETAMQFKSSITASSGNVIQVIMTSLGAVDNVINAIKSAVSIGAQ